MIKSDVKNEREYLQNLSDDDLEKAVAEIDTKKEMLEQSADYNEFIKCILDDFTEMGFRQKITQKVVDTWAKALINVTAHIGSDEVAKSIDEWFEENAVTENLPPVKEIAIKCYEKEINFEGELNERKLIKRLLREDEEKRISTKEDVSKHLSELKNLTPYELDDWLVKRYPKDGKYAIAAQYLRDLGYTLPSLGNLTINIF